GRRDRLLGGRSHGGGPERLGRIHGLGEAVRSYARRGAARAGRPARPPGERRATGAATRTVEAATRAATARIVAALAPHDLAPRLAIAPAICSRTFPALLAVPSCRATCITAVNTRGGTDGGDPEGRSARLRPHGQRHR